MQKCKMQNAYAYALLRLLLLVLPPLGGLLGGSTHLADATLQTWSAW